MITGADWATGMRHERGHLVVVRLVCVGQYARQALSPRSCHEIIMQDSPLNGSDSGPKTLRSRKFHPNTLLFVGSSPRCMSTVSARYPASVC